MSHPNPFKEDPQFEKIQSIKEIEPVLLYPNKTLVIFDIDYVLLHPEDPAFQMPVILKNKEKAKKIFYNIEDHHRDIFASLMVLNSSGCVLIEESTPDFIKKLHSQGFNTIALTASLTGSLPNGESLLEKRFNTLSEHGIKFTSKLELGSSPFFYEEFDKNFGSHPAFYQGILFANGENISRQKGVLLKKFLSQLDWKPEHFIFIDDRPENLADVSKAIAEVYPKATFKGFHYLGAFSFPSSDITTDEFNEKWNSLLSELNQIIE